MWYQFFLASETPYYGSNQKNYLRAGSAGPLLSGGPLADIRVCIPFLLRQWLEAREMRYSLHETDTEKGPVPSSRPGDRDM